MVVYGASDALCRHLFIVYWQEARWAKARDSCKVVSGSDRGEILTPRPINEELFIIERGCKLLSVVSSASSGARARYAIQWSPLFLFVLQNV